MDEPTSYLGIGLVVGIPGAFIACLVGLITGNTGFAHAGFALLVGACTLGGAFAALAAVIARGARQAAWARAVARGPVDRIVRAVRVGGARDGETGWLCARGDDLAFFPADAAGTFEIAGPTIVETVAVPSRNQLRIVTRDAAAWTWQLSLREWSGLPVARALAA